jgi:hypothetical protein
MSTAADPVQEFVAIGERAAALAVTSWTRKVPTAEEAAQEHAEVQAIIQELERAGAEAIKATPGVPAAKLRIEACGKASWKLVTAFWQTRLASSHCTPDTLAYVAWENARVEMNALMPAPGKADAPEGTGPVSRVESRPLTLSLPAVFRAATEYAFAIWDNRPHVQPGDDPLEYVPARREIDVGFDHLSQALRRPAYTQSGWHEALQQSTFLPGVQEALTGLYQAIEWERERDATGRRLPRTLPTAFALLTTGLEKLYAGLNPQEQDELRLLVSEIENRWGWQARAEGSGALRNQDGSGERTKANGDRATEQPDALSQLQYDILDALRSLKATDPEKRATGPQIAHKVGGDATDQSVKAPLSDLKKRELVDSKTGKGGGSWLTSAGLNCINSLRPKQ